ncbi:MAG: hypothetical protein ACLQOO_30040 [Terriglobia bacterium]
MPANRLSKVKGENKGGTVAERALERNKGRWPKTGFSERGSIERLVAEQAVKLERQYQRIFGAVVPVWSSDEEFQQCVQEEYDRRLADRTARKETPAKYRRLLPRMKGKQDRGLVSAG